MNKKWYEDWGIEYNAEENKLTSIKISLPNSHSEIKEFVITGEDLEKQNIKELAITLDCALTALSERDKKDTV